MLAKQRQAIRLHSQALTTLYLQQKAIERALDNTTKWFPLLPVGGANARKTHANPRNGYRGRINGYTNPTPPVHTPTSTYYSNSRSKRCVQTYLL